MKILVTGGAGFIGSHLVRALLAQGDDVTVLDNLTTGEKSHLPESGYTFWKEDIRDKATRERIEAAHFDAIVHLAAQTMVDASIRDPYFDMEENISGTVNVLEAARHSGVKRVVFASTAAAYGNVPEEKLPIREDYPLEPLSFYGLTKIGVEKYLSLYQENYGLDYVICRFANVYGERQGDKGEGGVISIFAKRLMRGDGLTIFGDGKQTRDFVYAGDIAKGLCLALKTKKVNTVYNLSTQTETSLLDLVRILEKASGHDTKLTFAKPREGDIFRSVLSNEKARTQLGWQPEITLEEGLKRTCQYFS